jgi:UDP:flavonoid glycosyltransferase YjiC (YdhE family)
MIPDEIKGQNILFAPLNWGLGHASRSHPIIKKLIENNNRVVLASDGDALQWLKFEFPDLISYSLPELKILYSEKRGAMGGIISRLPHFIKSIKKDFKAIEPIIKKENINLIISDNRYGVYYPGIHSILITHQLKINHPLGKLIDQPFRNLIEKFDEVWVPDYSDYTLSGDLSKPLRKLTMRVTFIGPQSRFCKTTQIRKEFKYLSIISGPEPYRSQINKALIEQLKQIDVPCAMVLGKPENEAFKEEENLSIWSDLSSHELENLIDRSETVICRSGYSSIMDMAAKEKKALLIPTPGQPEQIYLAKYHHNKGLFKSVFNKQDFSDFMIKGGNRD